MLPLALVAVVGIGAVPAAARVRDAGSRPDPVLLVHGFRGSSGGWHALEASLRAQGYRSSEIDAIDYDEDASNLEVARQIAVRPTHCARAPERRASTW